MGSGVDKITDVSIAVVRAVAYVVKVSKVLQKIVFQQEEKFLFQKNVFILISFTQHLCRRRIENSKNILRIVSKRLPKAYKDTHLMVNNPCQWVEECHKAGWKNVITFPRTFVFAQAFVV